MKKSYSKVLLILAFFGFVTQSMGQLIITEIADPNDADQCRYVEIYNTSATPVDLSLGWALQRFTNGDASPQAPVALTGTVPANGFFIICKDIMDFSGCFPSATCDLAIGSFGPADSNGDDHIQILDPSGAVADLYGTPGTDGTGTATEFEDGRVERASGVCSGVTVFDAANWNICSDAGGSCGPINIADGVFDPGVWAFEASCAGGGTCGITTITAANISECFEDAAMVPEYTLDISVIFSNPPATGTLTVDVTGGGSASIAVGSLVGNAHTFVNVQTMAHTLNPGGDPVSVTASFSDEAACTFTNINVGTEPFPPCNTPAVPTCFFTEDFEDATVPYTLSQPECNDMGGDYFTRTDGTDIGGNYNNPIGTFFFGANDIDGAPCMMNPSTMTFDDLSIANFTNVEFCIYLAEDDDGSNQDWDAADFFHITFDVDNSGTFSNGLWVEAEIATGTNGIPRIDTDFDGIGDGAEITDDFTQYCFSIPTMGSVIDINLEFSLNSGDEDIALDEITLCGEMLPPPLTCFFTEDFEDATVPYTLSQPECNDMGGDYFTRTDGTDIGGNYNNPIGTFFFGANDIDGAPCMMNPSTMTFDDLSIANFTNVEFCVYLAEDDDGSNQDWDAADFFHITYDVDNSGAFSNGLWVEAEIASGTNGIPRIDTDFDGIGDGAEITDDFTQYCFSIPTTGSVIDINLEFSLNSGDEDIALDEITLCGELVQSNDPTISQVDENGDGIPDILDPCDCADPENLTNMGVVYFHDFVTIISNPGEVWELSNVVSGALYQMDLTTTIGAGTIIPEVMPGVYHLDFWTESLVGFSAEFNIQGAPLAMPLATGGTCDASVCCSITGDVAGTPPSCAGDSDGTIEFVNVNCPTCVSTLEYSIDNVNFQPSPLFTGLAAGTYQAFIRDAGNFQCTSGVADFVLPDGSSNAPIIICPPSSATVECDAIPTPPTVNAVDLGNSGLPVWINEFHYDNTGSDVGEFIEVAGLGCTDLFGYTLELYNGSTGQIYNNTILGGMIPDEGDGFGAVSFPIAGIQNGAPDGIALVQNGVVIQFLSYEGTMTASSGTAAGLTSTDIGVFQPGTNPVMLSLQLMGTGTTYGDFTWSNPSAETPGVINSGQTLQANATVSFNEVITPGACSGESTIERTWEAMSACGEMTSYTQTLTVVDNGAPTAVCQDVTVQIDANGNATITPDQVDNGSTDNCGAVSLALDVTTFSCASAGNNTVTLTVTDDCGTASSCTATVTLEDNIPPTIICPQNIFVNLDPGACDAIVNWPDATAFDNCSATVVQTAGPTSGSTFDRNTTTTITYLATDASGNTSECSFNVEIIEYAAQSNIITCNQLVNVSLDENCQSVVSADQILTGNDYGCYDDYLVTFADGPNQGQPVIVGSGDVGQTINVMVTNPNGNPCWGSILVEDKLIPDLVCTDVTVRCDDATDPGSAFVATSDMVAPTMSADNATVTETVTYSANNAGVVDLNVTVSSDHTWVGDLVISVTSPSGTTVELMNNIGGPGLGCAGNGLDIVFDDDATATYTDLDNTCNNNPAAAGIFQPLQALSAFNGQIAAGDWTISVTDLAGGDSGDVDVTLNLSANSTIPFPVPATATITADGANTFTVTGFDPCGPATLTYTDSEGGDACAGTQAITRSWTITDGSNNTSTCTQTINITPTTIADIADQLPADITLECGDAIPEPITSLGCDNIVLGLSGDPSIIDICGNGFKMLRTYLVLDWCTNETLEHTQIIKVLDTVDPVLTCPADLTVSTSNNSCVANVSLIMPTATDCGGGVTFVVSASAGTISGNLLVGLPVGEHTVTFTGTDDCGNSSNCTQKITVEDQVTPTVVCDEHTVVALGSDGTALVNATTFDDGSNDNCGIVLMDAQRVTNPAFINPFLYGETVSFSCSDVGNTVMVSFRVTDAAGLTNTCMVEVEVQDKDAPIIACKPDINVNCDNPVIDAITVGQPLPASAILLTGEPAVSDNCNVTFSSNVFAKTIDDCGNGQIRILWTALDGGGLFDNCEQRINISDMNPFDGNSIVWPQDYEAQTCGVGLEPEDLASPYNYPTWNEGTCSNVASTHEDQVLDFGADNACLKILRKWIIIDWCTVPTGADPTDPATPGVWHYTQVIKVVNSSAPEISCEPDNPILVFNNFSEDCGTTFVPLVALATDDCTPTSLLDFSWAINNGQTGVGNNASGNFANGDYTITFTVSDQCGNTSTCVRSFSVVDKKKPTPVCIFGIASTVMPSTGSVTIWASDFESGSSYDNCTDYDNLIFSFSPVMPGQAIDDNITIACADVPPNGLVSVDLYVTDESGNHDFCTTFINVQDPSGICGPGPVAFGTIINEFDEPVEDVTVTIEDNGIGINFPVVTGSDGTFSFSTISNEFDLDAEKDMNYLNGVTTYDLVLISKHILGLELLDSPYKIIAADANHSESITALDIVKLRALILHIDDELADNESWRFIDANYVFPNPNNPFQEVFPEQIHVDLALPLSPAFLGVKIGDVNGTSSPNSLLGTDTRTMNGELTLQLDAIEISEGETFTMDFKAKDFNNIAGFQFTLGFDNSQVEFVDITTNLEGLSIENFGTTKLEEGMITSSWNSSKGIDVENEEILFSITFVAQSAVSTKDVITINSRYTPSEAYNGSDLFDVTLEFNGNEITNGFELYQNTPNPFKSETVIGFDLPEADEVTLKIYDVSGRVLKLIEMDAVKGYNTININRVGLDATGVLYYQLETTSETATKKMIIVD